MENGEPNDKRKKLIIGGTIASLLIVLIVIIIVATSGGDENPDETDDKYVVHGDNPMELLFATKPDFQNYTFENTDKNYEEQFWADDIFGGPITQPLHRPTKNEDGSAGTPIDVPNSMIDDLQENWENRGNFSGYFILRNVEYALNQYDDYWFFATNLTEEGYGILVAMNNTSEPSKDKKYGDVRKYLNGFVRDIYFTNHEKDKLNPTSYD